MTFARGQPQAMVAQDFRDGVYELKVRDSKHRPNNFAVAAG